MSRLPYADVCLVLEGTYPYVPGGVSSWVHHLVRSMPELTFSILHISPARGYFDKPAYDMPDNVLGVQELYLHEGLDFSPSNKASSARSLIGDFAKFLDECRDGDTGRFASIVRGFQALDPKTRRAGELLLNKENWVVLTKTFLEEAEDESFLNYFWNWYYAHQPLVNVLTCDVPEAGCYHTVSTGYAGVLAATAAVHTGRPAILTEHGIYTKERRIEIYAAEWIVDRPGEDFMVQREAPYFRRFWNRTFQLMSRICYDTCDELFTLYTGNVREQIKDGADPKKIRIIPNGIDLARFDEPAEKFREREPNERFTIGFVGRVCPIKDVRTLIAAMRLVHDRVPNVMCRILGPMEEDPEYAEDCQSFATALDLDGVVFFEGRVRVDDHLPNLDLLVLTSISEAQPLVVLEGGAVGLPVVATDVGSCQELLEGRVPEDRAIGVGGLIAPIASPGLIAEQIIKLVEDDGLRLQMGDSLQKRVERFYDQRDMVDGYREIYMHHSGRAPRGETSEVVG